MELGQDNETMPLRDGFNFTPIYKGSRVRMRISEDVRSAITRGPGFKVTVTDLDTGEFWDVHGLPCSLGERCYCDAEIRPAAPTRRAAMIRRQNAAVKRSLQNSARPERSEDARGDNPSGKDSK